MADAVPALNMNAAAEAALQGADFTDRRDGTVSDAFAHAPGRICKKCEQVIEARQPARRSGVERWVHDTCP